MTRRCTQGWEAGWNSTDDYSGTVSISSAIKHSGNYSRRCNPTGTNVGYCYVPGKYNGTFSEPQAVCSFYFRPELLPASNNEEIAVMVDVSGASDWYEQIRINSAGNLGLFTQAGAQVGSWGTTTLVTGTWYRIDYQFVQTTNVYTLKVGGVVELTGTSAGLARLNTKQFIVGKATNRNGQSVDFYYDDAVVDTDTFPGERSIIRKKVNGVGTYDTINGTTPHWQQVDEVPPSFSDQLNTDTTSWPGATFTVESCASVGIPSDSVINSAQVTVVVYRNDYNPLARFRIRSNSTDYDSSNLIACGLSNVWREFIWTKVQDPATSAPWTIGGLDAVEIGVFASSGGTALQSIYLMVEYGPSVGMGQVI